MKSRKTLKRSLSAILCAAILLNPIAAANATELPGGVPRSPEITEDYMEGKIPAYFNLWEVYASEEPDDSTFIGQSPTYLLWADISISICTLDGEEVENMDLGEFYSGTETSIIAGLPTVIRDKYGDRSKYTVTIIVTPINLPYEKTIVDINTMKTIDDFRFDYNNENEMRQDIYYSYVDEKAFIEQSGVIHLKAPQKREYKIGEEFDVTGGSISGFGEITKNNRTEVLDEWKVEERPLTKDDLDLSEFDNTKAGEYLIKAKPVNKNTFDYNKYTDVTVYDSFYVTVTDEDTTTSETQETAPEDELISGQQFRLRFSKLISNDYDKEQQTNVAKTENLSGMKFKLACDIWDNSTDEGKNVDTIDMGNFDLGDASEITVTIPEEILKKYNDTDRYVFDFTVKAAELPEDKVICGAGCFERDGSDTFLFTLSGDETVFDIYVRDKTIGHIGGYLNLTAPDKLVYNIGDELDLTGCVISGCGGAGVGENPYLSWDNFHHQPKIEELDVSEFDNTKAGEYTIRPKALTFSMTCDEVCDEVEYSSFTVTVIDNDDKNVSYVRGDANEDGTVDLSDSILIMQSIANPSSYGENGTNVSHITTNGMKNGDVSGNGDGITNSDALTIQKYMLKLIDSLS